MLKFMSNSKHDALVAALNGALVDLNLKYGQYVFDRVKVDLAPPGSVTVSDLYTAVWRWVPSDSAPSRTPSPGAERAADTALLPVLIQYGIVAVSWCSRNDEHTIEINLP